MKNLLATVWRPMRGVTIRSIGEGRYLFQFYHILDVQRVVAGSPWFFNNHPLIIHPLRKGEHPQRVPLNNLPLWVQIYELPHGFISEKVGIQLGNFLGKFLEYDKSNLGAAWLNYMRIQVEIDTSLPLKRWKKIAQKSGEPFLVTFKYKKLGLFCFVCGILGHTENFYEVRYTSSEVEPKREWGPFLKAPEKGTRRVVSNRWLREEKTGGYFEGMGLGEEGGGQGSTSVGQGSRGGLDGFVQGAGGVKQLGLVVSNQRVSTMGAGGVIRMNPTFEGDSFGGNLGGDLVDNEEDRKRKRGKMLANTHLIDVGSTDNLHREQQLVNEEDIMARRPDIIFLSETLASAARIENVRLALNFPNYFTVPCNGRSGGLAFLWNNKVSCSLLSYSLNHIDMKVVKGTLISRITGYYGYPERHRRHLSWSLLKHLASVSSLPWVIVGDFNDLLCERDKNGNVPHPLYLLRGFREAVDACGIWVDCENDDVLNFGRFLVFYVRRCTMDRKIDFYRNIDRNSEEVATL
ncbi:hypothetical protein ACS0TY_009761 [Phlomoides rotata]